VTPSRIRSRQAEGAAAGQDAHPAGQSAPAVNHDGADPPAAAQSRSSWRRNRKRTITAVVGVLVTVGFFYFVLPRIVGLGPTLRALRSGDAGWLLLGVAVEACSMLGDITTFQGVFAARGIPIGWRRTADVRMAGAAATKLLAAAGAGGIALTVWALRAWGLSGADVADGMVCYEIFTYGVYAFALAGAGFGLWFGVFSGPHSVGLTLIPACVATVVILVVLSMLKLHEPAERFLERRAQRSKGRAAKRWRRSATLPRTLHTGLVAALGMVRRRDPSVLGAVAYWGFDIGALWASFHAFGHSPPGAVLVTGYYLGTLGSALPLPGGIGGVEGGMIGAFIGFGVKAPLATVAVLGYRTISYWLPTVPGVIAYFHLRHTLGDSTADGQSAAA
jgi:putative heme transporter